MFGVYPHYDEAIGPHNPNDLQHRHPFPNSWHKPQPFDVRLCCVPRKSIAQRTKERTVRLVRLSTELTAIVLCNENGRNLIHLGTEPAQRRGMPTQSNDGVLITTQKPYLDRLLKMYLQLGVIKEKWIPQIREKVAKDGKAYIPEAEGVVRLKPVPFSIKYNSEKYGKTLTVYPVTEKPLFAFLREGESVPKGPWMIMPDVFFETHGRDGLPLDL